MGRQPGPLAAQPQLLNGQTTTRSHPSPDDADPTEPFAEALSKSLVLVHGGMAQNVGPILNMVTAKYLLRSPDEWDARGMALEIFDQILARHRRRRCARAGTLDDQQLGRTTQAHHSLGDQRIHRVDHSRGR